MSRSLPMIVAIAALRFPSDFGMAAFLLRLIPMGARLRASILMLRLTGVDWFPAMSVLITVIDDSPFKDFTYKCYGTPVDSFRSSLLSGIEKRKQGKQMKFRYGPTGKPRQAPDYKFSNISGNQILNEKYLILNKK